MKSLRELREDLTGIRISAASDSLWNIVATINDRARIAINDALNVYAFYTPEVYNSISPNTRVSVVPRDIARVVALNQVSPSSGKVLPVTAFNLLPTPVTCMLMVQALPSKSDTDSYLEMHYQSRLTQLPEDTFLGATLPQDNTSPIVSTGCSPVSYWRAPGYLEITHPSRTSREIVRYECVGPTGFSCITRAVVGEYLEWPEGSRISVVAPIADESVAVLMQHAEGNMYQFWVSHRTQYAQYTANAGLSAVDLSDVVTLVRLSDERAERRYAKITRATSPTVVRRH